MSDDPLSNQQREVQRLLGCCMLRMQQYERFLKAVLSQSQDAWLNGQQAVSEQTRRDTLAGNTLGQLVNALLTDVLVESANTNQAASARKRQSENDVRYRLFLQFSPQDRARLEAGLRQMVALRNDLVHHLIERFDVWTPEGCVHARQFLKESFDTIEVNLLALRGWHESLEAILRATVSALEGDEVLEPIDNTSPVASDIDIQSDVAGLFRDIWVGGSSGGWMRLDDAVLQLKENNPLESPHSHGCKSWAQVLQLCGCFEQTFRTTAAGRKEKWFRFRLGPSKVNLSTSIH